MKRPLLLLVAVGLLSLGAALPAGAKWHHPGRRCGDTHGYTIYRKGSTCRTAKRIFRRFYAGKRHLVKGSAHMFDSQLPFRVRAWRCGGLEGHIFCERGHWRSLNPPRHGHPWLDAVLNF